MANSERKRLIETQERREQMDRISEMIKVNRKQAIDELFQAIADHDEWKISQFLAINCLFFLERGGTVVYEGDKIEIPMAALDLLLKMSPGLGEAVQRFVDRDLEAEAAQARTAPAPDAPPPPFFDEEKIAQFNKNQNEINQRKDRVVQLLQAIDTGNTDEVKNLLNQDPTLLNEKATITLHPEEKKVHANAEELAKASKDSFVMGEILENYRRILNGEVEAAPPAPPAPSAPRFFDRAKTQDKGDDKKDVSTLEGDADKNKKLSPRGSSGAS